MIIIGYPGIGKSTLAGKHKCIDLESGNFWVDGTRNENWPIVYCNIANHLSKQGYTVFVSSHASIWHELYKSKEKVYVVYPSSSLEDKWIDKLYNRWQNTGLDKDFRAYIHALDSYQDDITSAVYDEFPVYAITDIDYNLCRIVCDLETGYLKDSRAEFISKRFNIPKPRLESED